MKNYQISAIRTILRKSFRDPDRLNSFSPSLQTFTLACYNPQDAEEALPLIRALDSFAPLFWRIEEGDLTPFLNVRIGLPVADPDEIAGAGDWEAL